jgi:hypothetical protein
MNGNWIPQKESQLKIKIPNSTLKTLSLHKIHTGNQNLKRKTPNLNNPKKHNPLSPKLSQNPNHLPNSKPVYNPNQYTRRAKNIPLKPTLTKSNQKKMTRTPTMFFWTTTSSNSPTFNFPCLFLTTLKFWSVQNNSHTGKTTKVSLSTKNTLSSDTRKPPLSIQSTPKPTGQTISKGVSANQIKVNQTLLKTSLFSNLTFWTSPQFSNNKPLIILSNPI